jgi:hypothetical protein
MSSGLHFLLASVEPIWPQNANTAALVNREQLYVSVSRPRIDARIYTDDAEALRRAVSRDPRKEIALDAIKQRPTQELQPQRQTIDLQPRQSHRPSLSIRI